MAVTGPVTEVMRAGGSHIPDLLDRVERPSGRGGRAATARCWPSTPASTIAAGGKRLRPLLVFLAADTEEGDGLVRAAAAVELVHSATLVHDDVLDAAACAAACRPWSPSAGAAPPPPPATCSSPRAFAELAANGRADEIQRPLRGVVGAGRGRAAAARRRLEPEVSLERYLRRCELKTARLFEAACRLGALEGDGAARASSAPSGGASAWPSSCSTTSSTSRARPRAPASSAGPTCSTAR